MPRHPLSLREAAAADVPFLADLWSQVLRPGADDQRVADLLRVVERAAAAPDERLVVADLEGERAGAVLLRVATVTPLDLEPAVHAHSPHVTQGSRRRGVGRALVAAAAGFAEERGIERVMTASVSSSREANRFLARLGLGPLATVRTAPAAVVRARVGGEAVDARAHHAPRRSRAARQVVAVRRAVRAERTP